MKKLNENKNLKYLDTYGQKVDANSIIAPDIVIKWYEENSYKEKELVKLEETHGLLHRIEFLYMEQINEDSWVDSGYVYPMKKQVEKIVEDTAQIIDNILGRDTYIYYPYDDESYEICLFIPFGTSYEEYKNILQEVEKVLPKTRIDLEEEFNGCIVKGIGEDGNEFIPFNSREMFLKADKDIEFFCYFEEKWEEVVFHWSECDFLDDEDEELEYPHYPVVAETEDGAFINCGILSDDEKRW